MLAFWAHSHQACLVCWKRGGNWWKEAEMYQEFVKIHARGPENQGFHETYIYTAIIGIYVKICQILLNSLQSSEILWNLGKWGNPLKIYEIMRKHTWNNLYNACILGTFSSSISDFLEKCGNLWKDAEMYQNLWKSMPGGPEIRDSTKRIYIHCHHRNIAQNRWNPEKSIEIQWNLAKSRKWGNSLEICENHVKTYLKYPL